MRIEFDRDTCIGMFQCVAEWDAFERDEDAGKAILADTQVGNLSLSYPSKQSCDGV